MAVAIPFALLIAGTGFGVLRLLGASKTAGWIGLAPAAGLAVLTSVCTWSTFMRLRPPLSGVLVLVCGLVGLVMLVRTLELPAGPDTNGGPRPRRLPTWCWLLGAAPLLAALAMAVAFQTVQAPLSTDDGGFHVATADALRNGRAWAGWYPPGLAALVGATLQVMPWLDSALGAFDLMLASSLLTPLVVFGLALAVWHDLSVGALAAVAAALTYLFAYYTQIWSGWPLALGLLLLLGLWTVGLEYLDRPHRGWAVLSGLIVGGILVTHGTEVYSAAIILLTLLVARRREAPWRRLPGDLALAAVVAALCAAPYLPNLLQFASGGAAVGVGFDDAGAVAAGARSGAVLDNLVTFTLDGLGIDLPVRVVLLTAGAWWALRQGVGRSVLLLGGLFFGLAVVFGFFNGVPLVRQVYAVAYPWGLAYRLIMVSSVAGALLAGLGGVVLARAAARRVQLVSRPARRRRLVRIGRLAVVTWLVLSTWALSVFLWVPVPLVSSFGPDDAQAMQWLRANASPDAVVANDTFADAGIWVPFKTGLAIVADRITPFEPSRQLVLDNIAHLDEVPAAAAAACALHVEYVYYGAKNTSWKPRSFPPPHVLRASAALQEVFASGDAAIFRTRLACPD